MKMVVAGDFQLSLGNTPASRHLDSALYNSSIRIFIFDIGIEIGSF